MRVTRVFTVFAAVALLGVACEDDATGIPAGLEVFTASLNGAAEKPDARTTPATGQAIVTVMEDVMSWRIEVTNLSNLVDAHIYVGVADSAGGVVWGLNPIDGDYPTTSVVSVGTIQGDTVAFLAGLMRNGRAYVNLHTNDLVDPPNTGAGDFPGGEIRGQLVRQ